MRAMVTQLFGPDVRVVYDNAGKPALEGVDVFISVSHTAGYAAIAYSETSEVGLDMELDSRSVLAVANRFMQGERLVGLSPYDANRLALCHWCSKEALFKITGDLGGNFKDNISVASFDVSLGGSFPVGVVGLGYKSSYIADYLFVDGLLIVLCHG